MITKEELDKKIQDIQEKFKYLEQELESLYQEASKKDPVLAKRIEKIQFSDYFNPTRWAGDFVPFDFKIFYDILKENENSKVDVDEVEKMKNTLNNIKTLLKTNE